MPLTLHMLPTAVAALATGPDAVPFAPSVMLAAVDLKDGLLIAGILLLTISLLRMAYIRRRRSGQAARLSPQEMLERNRQMRGMQGDLEALMSEIEQLSRRFAAQLDAKSRRIERLLEKADERIQGLLDMEDQASPPGRERRDAAAGRPSPPAQDDDPATLTHDDDLDTVDPLAEKVYELADQGMDPRQIAGELHEHIGKIELILALRSAT